MTPTPPNPTRRTARPIGTVSFVGAGPGDLGLLTVRAVDLLAQADVIVIDQLSREDLLTRYARPDVEVLDAGFGDDGQPLTRATRAKLVVKAAKSAARVVRLLDGDGASFNGLAEEALACLKAQVPFEVVPGVSAISAVPAYAGVPLTDAKTRAIHVIHPAQAGVDVSGATASDVTAVLLGSPDGVIATLSALLDAGRDPQTPVILTEQGTTVEQRTVSAPAPRRREGGPGRPDGQAADGRRRLHGRVCATSSPGSRPSRCSAGGSWCPAPASRPAR